MPDADQSSLRSFSPSKAKKAEYFPDGRENIPWSCDSVQLTQGRVDAYC
jgi:hypothetical protein